MKVYMKKIKMIAWFAEDGIMTPMKFQMEADDKQYVTIKVDTVSERSEEKLAGNRMFIYRCQSLVDGILKQYELKFEINHCQWYLYKM